MKYNFDKLTDRFNTYSYKWNVSENELPMWVADMDFETSPEISEELQKRMDHKIFGYTDIPDRWRDSYVNWWKIRHNHTVEKEWLVFCTGIVPAISSLVRKLTTPAEKVVIQTPVYNMFFNSIINNGRQVLESPLVYENGEYHIDFNDLESKLSDPQATLMILCNPHNPIGKIWGRETLEKIGNLCEKHGVTVISDEIHCDLTSPNTEYVPFSGVSETCKNISITCIAPTKTFNIAGLQTAAVYSANCLLRHKAWRGINTDEVGEPNAFAVTAAIAAFEKGGPWLDELREYIHQNKLIAEEYIKNNIPTAKYKLQDATYLLWIDLGDGIDSEEATDFIRSKTGLFVTPGGEYGESGKQFIRMNVACPRMRLLDGLERLKKGLELYHGK